MKKICPCGSGLRLPRCCLPYIMGQSHPLTALQLMRSRYAAFCRDNMRYLLETSMGPARTAHQAADATPHTQPKWTRLEILRVEAGGPEDEKGLVEFRAHYRVEGRAAVLHEVSRFEKHGGRWFYVEGDLS